MGPILVLKSPHAEEGQISQKLQKIVKSSVFEVEKSLNRGVRGHRQKMRKNSMKLGTNAQNRLKINEKAKILAPRKFSKKKKKKKEISWKEELSHPCLNMGRGFRPRATHPVKKLFEYPLPRV